MVTDPIDSIDTKTESVAPGSVHQNIVRQNISSVHDLRRQMLVNPHLHDKVINAISHFAGSKAFLAVHVAWFGGWILWNFLTFSRYSQAFDPYPFSLLTLAVSLEAIFLSTFLLISQNREAKAQEQEAALDLQINLLTEQRSAQMLELLEQMIDQLNKMDNHFQVHLGPQVKDFAKSPAPSEVMQALEESQQDAKA